ncbi:50S ribosomal protein L4 [bacterium]|nr:50S ribosomal protein L4 [bacterium]
MKAPLFDQKGKEAGTVELPDSIFGVAWNGVLVSQSYRVQVSNGKKHTASTKTRGQVRGSTRKIFRQKGTGRARMGGIRNPIRRGGGVIFGPQNRFRKLRMPRKARRKALFSALSRKLSDGEIKFVKIPKWKDISSKKGKSLLEKNGIEGKVLVLLEEGTKELSLAFRNLPGLAVLPGKRVNIGDLFRYRTVVISPESLDAIKEIWG